MRQPSNPTVLVVTHVCPHPPSAGNELRIHHLLRWFLRANFQVILLLSGAVADDSRPGLTKLVDHLYCVGDRGGPSLRQSFPVAFRYLAARARARARRLRKPTDPTSEPSLVGMLCSPAVVERTRRIVAAYQPAILVAEYIGMSPCLEEVGPGVLKIIDTIDVYSQRHAKVVAQGVPDPYGCTEAQERKALLRADVILAIQPEEAAIFKRLVPERTVLTVGVDFDPAESPAAGESESPVVLIVASGNRANIEGVGRFCENAWPLIQRAVPAARLLIAGKVCEGLDARESNVERLGVVKDLDAEYRQATVVVNPVFAGTGLKIKTAEALAHGKCLVTWPIGADGLPVKDRPPFRLAQSWEDMAAVVAQLLADPEARGNLERSARAFARDHFSTRIVYAELAADLERRGLLPAPR